MPSDDRATKTAERCHTHPGRPAVTICDACGRPICVSCAIPVRGQTIGAECIEEVLGAPPQPADPYSRPRVDVIAGAALALATFATLLPWTRFSTGSSLLGAWDRTPRWSMLAAVAAVVGLLGWLAIGRRRPTVGRWVALLAGCLVLPAAGLAFVNPPAFTKPWLGPVVSALGGVIALVAGVLGLRLRPARPVA